MVAAIGPSASPAGAVTIGDSSFVPTGACGSALTFLANVSPASHYAAPSAGVITSWTFRTGADAPSTLRLKVGRNVGGLAFVTVGQSAREFLAPGQAITFPTRVPVQGGDVIGFAHSSGFTCANFASPGYDYVSAPLDPAPGTTTAYTQVGVSARFPISAQLEPDVDNDGFGDETQDLCPSDAQIQTTPCRDKAPPETTFTKQPKKKEKKKSATFEFSSPEPGATFRCSLNGSPFELCTSPRSVKAKKGLNTITVFARDAAGNVDDSPATYSWTFKKRKK